MTMGLKEEVTAEFDVASNGEIDDWETLVI